MKYYSEIEGYEDCYVEVVDKWSMKELRKLTESDETNYFDLFREKTDSILIRDIEGNELRDINKFDEEFAENLDVAMAGFIGGVLATHVRNRRSLGGLSVRPSSTISEQLAKKK